MQSSKLGGANILTASVAGVLLAGSIYLFQFDGWQQLRGLIRTPSIQVQSTSRLFVDGFFSGEKLRFGLSNVEASRVFWIFDEKEIVPGDIELEYRFAYSADRPLGQASDHRVDALYKVDGRYRSLSRFVRVENVDMQARLAAVMGEIQLSIPQAIDSSFALNRAVIGSFGEGEFHADMMLNIEAGVSEHEPSGVKNIGWLVGPSLSELMQKEPWLQLEFVNEQTDEKLIFIDQLSNNSP